MTRDALINEYFNWMCGLVCNGRYSSRKRSYQTLLSYLHEREFIYILGMDGNRAEDGIDLRYQFACERGYEYAMITRYLDDRPCSILEMMIALAFRCEEHIMESDVGNRTGQWFWNMISNLGLESMRDSKFDKNYVDEVLDRFLNREYKRNGEGGLFVVDNCKQDLRNVEIWYQMHLYLDTIL